MTDGETIFRALEGAVGGEGDATARGASALRIRCELQPAGGPGTKVMPPTYAGPNGPVYIEEERRLGADPEPCVSLDSVASQANRLEATLSEEVATKRLSLPTIWVDQREFGVNSALDFSHRVFDAWVEDAEWNGERFGDSNLGQQLARSKRRNLTHLMTHSPSSILLGCWASRMKDPQGAARLPRIVSSEIIAVGALDGTRAAGRIDLHNVSSGISVYRAERTRITIDEGQAMVEKGKPVRYPGKRGEQGRPSAAGYGNVTPSLAQHGGITMKLGLQITTVSLPGLRECRFPQEPPTGHERNVAGRLMLAALALRMLALQVEYGYDLRSGCLLVPAAEPTVELVDRVGKATASWPIVGAPTEELLERAVEEGVSHGFDWSREPLQLTASEAQLELLRQSLAERSEEEA